MLTAETLSDAAWVKLEIALCAADPLYWIAHHGFVKDERGDDEVHAGTVHGPGLELWSGYGGNPSQQDFVNAVIAGQWIITGKARQIGVSWLLRLLECWGLMFQPNTRYGIVAQGEEQAKTHLLRVQWIYEQQPEWLKLRRPIPRYMNTKRFGLANPDGSGLSVVEAHPCTSAAVRGISAKRIALEEFAFWPSYGTWPGLVGATADSGGQLVIASTANGEGNPYHKIWLEAERGDSAFKAMFFPWQTHPKRDAAWYQGTLKKSGSLALMQQEFPASSEEMFIASGSRFFDAGVLKALEKEFGAQPLEMSPAIPAELRAAVSQGALLVYELPIAGRSYIIAGDPSNTGGDACVAQVLDARTGEQVAKYSSHVTIGDRLHDLRMEPHDFGLLLVDLAIWFNYAFLSWEDNSMGAATGAAIMRTRHYRNLYTRQEVDPARQSMEARPGWLTTTGSRGDMLGGLQAALRDGAIKPRDAVTYRQLRQFAWIDGKPQAPNGEHDDEVTSLAIAEMARQQWLLHDYEPLVLAV